MAFLPGKWFVPAVNENEAHCPRCSGYEKDSALFVWHAARIATSARWAAPAAGLRLFAGIELMRVAGLMGSFSSLTRDVTLLLRIHGGNCAFALPDALLTGALPALALIPKAAFLLLPFALALVCMNACCHVNLP